MNQVSEKENLRYCDTYPQWVIFFRWIVLTIAFALGIYILSDVSPILGIAYVICGLLALTLVLPLSRCVSCYYFGKLCNTGWGKVAAYLYAKGDESQYQERYNYSILLHFLWMVPLLISFFQLTRKMEFRYAVFFLAYVLVLWIEKVVLKKLACKRCHQREFCPALPFKKLTKN